ncbi:MAG: tRNA (adenosine(37)-N6)-threonylcarbamoyltransferase complex ATPase subunit type 1 TsaE [Bryobacteraceae bacterium]|nr:tRNA (adenosine(37)-N6)-threonylcarbamoyltransferase complex ATPase subunit type 1 TsaE [Bryobacteraceae bacterium]
MKPDVYITHNEDETIALGERLAALWPVPVTILLIGDLGAGKTTLAKGLAAGYGGIRPEEVSSPTFPLIHEYGDPTSVYHIDLYRLDTIAEVESLGLDEIFARPAAVFLEWAERFPSLLPAPRIEINISSEYDESENESRRIEVRKVGV